MSTDYGFYIDYYKFTMYNIFMLHKNKHMYGEVEHLCSWRRN